MDARAIIAKLRDRRELQSDEMVWFANGLANGNVTDAQAAAFAMAACLNGMPRETRVELTLAMRDSGNVMSWDLPGPVVDKHSTGGIGDCVSLLLAPALAAAGVYVPMISGRGLGHTGGTLDKMEAIPGLNTEVSEDRFRDIVRTVGAAIVSATDDIAPADKRLYAIRDVTATVESVDLITASILSKKLAAGLETLVLDVKVGSGAFMKTIQDAEELANSLVETANGAGCKTSALITDMDQSAAPSVGNAVEVIEVMKILTSGDTNGRLCDLTVQLGGECLMLAGATATADEGAQRLQQTISDGSAAERFGKIVAELGGPSDFLEHWGDQLPKAPVVHDVIAEASGYVNSVDGEALGLAVVRLGGGRQRGGDVIDPSVGFSEVAMIADKISAGDVIARIHAADETAAAAAEAAVRRAYVIGQTAPPIPPLVHRSIR